ncbi:Si-specific NAD(P)(+) transhydrogenase [Nakamurella sp.]|uniref:Si-specific NAD(P)(+) transhydrogenase n=1 Tax=Nakamurella sp. TaxID=1869182 RepID=UPI003782F280
MDSYDMIVIGSGPAGQKAAIAAAKLGRRAAIVERRDMVGGVCINTGTIPSKTLREAVLYLTGLNQRELYGQSYRVKQDITISDLSARTQHVIGREIDVIRNQLARNHVHMYVGTARFTDPRTIVVTNEAGNSIELRADKIVIAVGTKPAHPSTVDFDGETIVDSDQILSIAKVPSSMVVVGAGVIGIEYASMFAALGTKVTIIERRPTMLDFCDKEIIEALQYQLRELAVTFRYSETVREVQKHPAGTLTVLESGKKIPADTVLYSAGRQGLTDELNVAAAGLAASNRGKVEVNENFQTEVGHVYAVGDVIGFPALAATAMEQGRRAAYHAFDEPVGSKLGELQPIGIYTIPELSFVGRTEESLTSANVPFEVGVSRYRELARGAILGDSYGMLKILVHAESRELLGVHVFGTNATELVHIGQTVMGCGGTVDYLVDTVFNYPTLAESYKVAALDAVNKMRAIARVTQTGPYHPLPE